MSHEIDYRDPDVISARLMSASKKLHEITIQTADAENILKWEGERAKNILSDYVDTISTAASKAEAIARKNPEYRKRLDELIEQSKSAREQIKVYKDEERSFEAARSLLSMCRESMRQLQG
jgi:uncharacterized membrane protein YccC